MGPGLGAGLGMVTVDGATGHGRWLPSVCRGPRDVAPTSVSQGPLCLSHAAPKLRLPAGTSPGKETPHSCPPSAQCRLSQPHQSLGAFLHLSQD